MVSFIENSNPNQLPDKTDRRVKAFNEQGQRLKKYTIEDVETILRLLAYNGGNRSAACTQAREMGLEIHPLTLGKWEKEQFPQRYADVQREISDEVNDRVAGKIGDLTIRGTLAQERLLDKLDDELNKDEPIPIKELAPSIKNIAQANDFNVRQRQLLHDKPTSIMKVETIDESLAQLKREGIIDIDEEDIEDLPETIG